jgi:predicted enzyme related to lactoylglutathione lyase
MTDRKPIPGKFVWFEHVSGDAKKAQAFYRDVLDWNVLPFPMGNDTYEMIATGETPDTMIGGYTRPGRAGQPAHWIAYVSVDDVDAAARAATAGGGRVVEPPSDMPEAGRVARIADPQGAELCLIRNPKGDRPDAAHAPAGTFFWHELHTSDAKKALAFYEKVVGFTHRAMDMGPAGTYYVIGKGGADRGGVTEHLPPGTPPHWLPYVAVDDADDVAARARKAGGTVHVAPQDIPGIGRFAVLQDPTGAFLAVMKPMPASQRQENESAVSTAR